MKFCTHCGAQLEDEAKFCTSCGNAVESAAPSVEPAPAPTYTAPAPEPTPAPAPTYTAPTYAAPTPTPAAQYSLKMPIMALIFGACGLGTFWLAFLGGFPGLISIALSIVGFVLGNKAKVTNPGSKMAQLGRIFGLIGIILGGILTIIFIIIFIAAASRY